MISHFSALCQFDCEVILSLCFFPRRSGKCTYKSENVFRNIEHFDAMTHWTWWIVVISLKNPYKQCTNSPILEIPTAESNYQMELFSIYRHLVNFGILKWEGNESITKQYPNFNWATALSVYKRVLFFIRILLWLLFKNHHAYTQKAVQCFVQL